MISKSRFLVAIKLSLAIIFLMTAIAILPKVFSRYQSTANSNTSIDVAFYIIKQGKPEGVVTMSISR